MLFSDYNYRSIFEQTGLSFDLNLSINNITGSGAFGFSGEGNQIQFTFQSGKIFDFENRYVNSYLAEKNINISGDLENINYSYYINNVPIAFNGIKNDFKVQRFFYNASGCVLDSSLNLNGADPASFSFVLPETFPIGKTYTGQILNNVNNLAFKIFSGSLTPTGNFSINSISSIVSGLKSGLIKLNTVNEVGGYSLTLDLYTNFGLVTKNFNVTGLYQLESIVNLFLITENLSIISGVRDVTESNFGQLTYNYQDLSGNVILQEYNNLPLSITFQYFSGITGLYLGDLLGSGYGYNLIGTGIITEENLGEKVFDFTGYANITGYNFTGGLYTGSFPATGKSSVIATGIFDYNIIYPGSGFFTGLAIGEFPLNYYVQYFTGGLDFVGLAVNTAGTGALTGFNTTWLTGYVSGTGFIFSGIVTGNNYLYLANTASGLATGLLSGEISQYLTTGIPTFSPGSFSRIPKLVTGNFRIIDNNLAASVGYSGVVFNKNNLYASYKNLYDLGLANINGVPSQSTITANFGLLTGFSPTSIERKGLLIFNSGNPNDFFSNPIFNINAGEVRKIITYPDSNLTFVVGNFSSINGTGRWNGFLLTGNNFQLTGWDPRVRYGTDTLQAFVNDIFLTGDNVYIGGYFNEVNLVSSPSYSALAKNKLGNNEPTTLFNFGTNKTITNLTNLDDKLYVFGNFNNFLSSGNYTDTAISANPRDLINDDADGYYNSLLIIDPSNDKAIADPYDAHWLDYLGVTGYNQFNFNHEVLNSNYTVNNILKTTGNKNYIVGNFSPIGIKRRIGLAVYDESENLMAYNPEIYSSSNNINFGFESGNIIYLGGAIEYFGAIKYDGGLDIDLQGTQTTQNFLKLNNPFTVDRALIPPVLAGNNKEVYDFDFYNNNVYLVGSFDKYIPKTGDKDDPSTYIARSNCIIFNQSGRIQTGDYQFDDYVKTIYVTGFTGFFGGNFTQVTTNSTSITSRDRFAAINLITHEVLPITGNFDGVVNQINHYTGNHILVVGEFDSIATDNIPTITNVYGLSFLDTKPTPTENINLITNRTTSQSSNNNFKGFTKFISNNNTGFYLYGNLSNDIDINDINLTSLGDTTYNNSIIQLNITGGIQTGFRPSIEDQYGSHETIYTAIASDNKVIIGGNFTYINGTGSSRIAMLNSGSGVLDLNYTGYQLDNTVYSNIYYNDSVISVGSFNEFSGNKRGERFLYHHSGTTDVYNSLKFYSSLNYPIYKIKEYNNNLYLCGKNLFTSTASPIAVKPLDSTKQFGLIALDNSTTGFFIPDLPNRKLPFVNEPILCFSTGTSGIYIGGYFTEVNNQIRTGLALIDYNGNVLNWNPKIQGGDEVVYSIVNSGNTAFIGGNFNSINNLSIPSLCKIRTDTDGTNSSDVFIEFLPDIDQGTNIYNIYLDTESIFLGGDFNTINNQTCRGFTELNTTDGTTVPNSILFTNLGSIVNKIVKTGETFLIGGDFNYSYQGNNLSNFLPINRNGIISNYPTGLFSDNDSSKEVKDIFLGKNNKIYICGNLSKNSNANENLGGALSLDFNSGINLFTWNRWTPYLQNSNPDIIFQSKKTDNIFVLNRFNFAGHLREGLCEINNSGKINLNFNPRVKINNSANQYVKSLTIFNQTGIIIGGKFTRINGENNYSNLALINTNDSSSSNLNIYLSHELQSIYSTGASNIYLGGNFIKFTGSNYVQNFANFIEIPTGNTKIVTNNISFINNTDGQNGSINIDINSISHSNNKFLIGGNFNSINPYLVISGSGSFVSGNNYVTGYITGTGNLTLTNSSGIYRNLLTYSGLYYSSTYNFNYVTNENTVNTSTLNRNINDILNINKYTQFTGTGFYLETGSGIITGIQTLIRSTGSWFVTGVFTGYLSGSVFSSEYILADAIVATGNLTGFGYALNSISGDSFISKSTFTGSIQVNQSYLVDTYTGLVPSGTYFVCDTSNFFITGINVTGSKIITGYYTGLSSGLILQSDSQGNILANPSIFRTSGDINIVTGALGITVISDPTVYATGIFSYTTGDILTTGYLTGIPQYNKIFSGMFNISTGIFNEASGDTFYSGLTYDATITGYSGHLIYNTGTIFSIKIDFLPFQDYNPMIGLLTLSGTGNTIYTSIITGI